MGNCCGFRQVEERQSRQIEAQNRNLVRTVRAAVAESRRREHIRDSRHTPEYRRLYSPRAQYTSYISRTQITPSSSYLRNYTTRAEILIAIRDDLPDYGTLPLCDKTVYNSDCVVCNSSEKMVALNCKHIVCFDCLEKISPRICPICRCEFSSDSIYIFIP
jgi:hypothetical protein